MSQSQPEPALPASPSDGFRRLAQVVNLVTVRTIQASFSLESIHQDDVVGELPLQVQAMGLRSPDSASTVRVVVKTSLDIRPVSAPDRTMGKIEASMALDYLVRDETIFALLTEEDLKEFAARNGLYNAWPYLREFFQSTSMRMGLPTLVIGSLPPPLSWSKVPPRSPSSTRADPAAPGSQRGTE